MTLALPKLYLLQYEWKHGLPFIRVDILIGWGVDRAPAVLLFQFLETSPQTKPSSRLQRNPDP